MLFRVINKWCGQSEKEIVLMIDEVDSVTNNQVFPDHKTNSPWNIAADFLVDMSFSAEDILGMLTEYENAHKTGMNLAEIAGLIYDYTSGYPYLVSRICKFMDERLAGVKGFQTRSSAWTKAGFWKL